MATPIEGSTRELPQVTERNLIVKRGRSGLLIEPPYKIVLDEMNRLGRDTGEYVTLMALYQRAAGSATILGVKEETRRRFLVTMGEEQVDVAETTPSSARNIWVGENIQLMAPDLAAKYQYAGSTALAWATGYEANPEMIVHARDGYFYPATKKDLLIKASIS